MKKPLTAREEPKEIALTYISDDKKVLLVVPEKMLVIMTEVVLGGIALQKAIGKQFFSQKVEIDCPKTTGIKLKDLNTGVNRNKRLGQELTAIDSIVPTEVVNAPLVKLTREQLLDQRLPDKCTKDKIWFPQEMMKGNVGYA